jgi:hypothetical protein
MDFIENSKNFYLNYFNYNYTKIAKMVSVETSDKHVMI